MTTILDPTSERTVAERTLLERPDKLAGRTVKFHAAIKGVRNKELPELNDEFAKDLGDYQNLEELKEAIRKSILAERQFEAQQDAKNKLVETLVDAHEFPIPEVFVDRQIQNRLEHSIENLSTSSENLTASESRIRDADMASEMVMFTRNNILSQAGTSILAQANQLPQGVLSLLR